MVISIAFVQGVFVTDVAEAVAEAVAEVVAMSGVDFLRICYVICQDPYRGEH